MTTNTNISRLALSLVLVVAFALRIYRLAEQELRGDESFGYFFSLRPYVEMTSATLELKEPHPLAGYFVQKAWLGWAGESEFALRFSSLWFGVLAVALLYRLGHQLALGWSATVAACLLLAVSPYAVWHSQDARMYSMSLALTIASSWLALGWLQRPHWGWASVYVVVSWLALHTHYFCVFVLLGQNLFVLSRALWRPRLRMMASGWLWLQGILLALYLPWLLEVAPILGGYRGNGDSPGFMAMLWRSLSVLAVGESTPAAQRPWWALLAGGLVLLGCLTMWREQQDGRRGLWLLLLYLAIPLLATWYGARERPIFNERYLVAAAPPLYLLAAAGVDRMIRIRGLSPLHPFTLLPFQLVSLSLTLLLGVGMVLALVRHYSDPVFSKTRGWRELAVVLSRWADGLPAEQVRIAQNFPDPTLWYYYRGPVSHLVLPPAAQDGDGARATVEQLAAEQVMRVLLPLQPAPNWDDQQIAATVLGERYRLAAQQSIGVWPVQLYAAAPITWTMLGVVFENNVTLAGLALQPPRLTPGGYLVVQLAWQGETSQLTGTEKVFVQLLNGAGQLVAQDDRALEVASLRASGTSQAIYAIRLPNDLAVGEHPLIVGLYDPGFIGAPRVLTSTGADFVTVARLGR
jgi:hypothetical protein